MIIEFPSPEEFRIKPFNFNGSVLYLVNPKHIGVKWNRNNLIFRSSIWTPDGLPVSLGYKKFFNWGEHPELTYTPFSLTMNGGCQLIDKIDGSCLIVSKYKGNLMIRTRGTSDASTLKNGYEIEYLKTKYPKAFNNEILNSEEFTIIYEWVTPTNKIVISYGDEPELVLTGIVKHEDYSYVEQVELDTISDQLFVRRPKSFKFSSVKEMLTATELLMGREGLCVYCNRGQDIRKVKSDWYKARHALKSNLTTDKLADIWFLAGQPSYEKYCEEFQKQWDWELFDFARGAISNLFEGIKEYNKIMAHLREKVESRKSWNRKDFAIAAQQEYGATKKFSVAMNLYLGKPLEQDVLKHILLQNTKQMELGIFKEAVAKEEDL